MREHGFLSAPDKAQEKYSLDFLNKPDITRRTLGSTIEYDRKLILGMQVHNIVDIAEMNNFLLAGCATPLSLQAMESLIGYIKEGSPASLFAVDISPIAIDALKSAKPPEQNDHITRHLVRADLRERVFSDASMDYIRMDYLQNFTSADRQEDLLGNLGQILSPNGTIVSTVDILNTNEIFKDRHALPKEYLGSGTYYHPRMKFRCFVPSTSFIENVAARAGLSVQPIYINNRDALVRYFTENPDNKPKLYPTGAVVDEVALVYRHL